jgi:hypothetical protein
MALDDQQYAEDMAIIRSGVRNLAQASAFSGLEQLDEMCLLAYEALKVHLQKDGTIYNDPTLSIEAFKLVFGARNAVVEIKRKTVDTVFKLRSGIEPARLPYEGAIVNPPGGVRDPLDENPHTGEGASFLDEDGAFGGILGGDSKEQ